MMNLCDVVYWPSDAAFCGLMGGGGGGSKGPARKHVLRSIHRKCKGPVFVGSFNGAVFFFVLL